MERRSFLGGLTAASFGALLENSFAQPVLPTNSNKSGGSMAGRDSFESSQVEVSGNAIFVRRYGKGPAILMVHGFPRTSLMWRFLAPNLAGNESALCVDVRAYGGRGVPASPNDHF